VGFATRDHHGLVMSDKQAFSFPYQEGEQVKYRYDGWDREPACIKQLSKESH